MATKQFLDFEKPVIDLEEEVLRLRAAVESGDQNSASQLKKTDARLTKLYTEVYGKLTAYQRTQLSRSPDRPQTLDIIARLFTNFVELHGDRRFGEDGAVVGGPAKFDETPVMVIGHQRGRDTQEKVKRNFGSTQPEGNRKAHRLYLFAEKFNLPLLLFIDTQGAYPGIEGEERGQAEAIATCLHTLATLRVPIISTVIGEGGSGGALALGICDRLLMMENSTYSVISPEGCAAILWGKNDSSKAAEYAKVAAEALKITAPSLAKTGFVDEVIKEPPGGAHRNREIACDYLGKAISRHLREIRKLSLDELLNIRYEKFRQIGV